jgi:hypothetical protein
MKTIFPFLLETIDLGFQFKSSAEGTVWKHWCTQGAARRNGGDNGVVPRLQDSGWETAKRVWVRQQTAQLRVRPTGHRGDALQLQEPEERHQAE